MEIFRVGTWAVTVELVISMCAIGLTLYQSFLTRKHNRLSLRPHLVWGIDRQRSADNFAIHFTLKNEGIGPALIKDRYFELDGKRFHSDDVKALAKTLLEDQFSYHIAKDGLPGIGASMPPSRQIIIAEVNIGIQAPEDYEKVETILKRTSFNVRYKSLYGESLKFL